MTRLRLISTLLSWALALPAAGLLCACSSDKPQSVSAQDFYARHIPNPSPISGLDQPGQLPSIPDARPQNPPPPPAPRVPTNNPVAGSDDFDGDEPAPDAPPATAPSPTTLPDVSIDSTTNPSTESSAQNDDYTTVGGVVAVVNGTPIYANKVIRLITPALRQYAREYDQGTFEIRATADIDEQIKTLVSDELVIALAERSLDPKDIQLAWALAHEWREKQVAEAGGSEQLAKARAEVATGEDFQEQEEDVYRDYLRELYNYHKIDPDIVFTDQDYRNYYQDHLSEFSMPAKATAIILEADPVKRNQDPDLVRKSIENIRKRCLQGEDFAQYARTQNDFPGAEGTSGNGGEMTGIAPHSLVFSQVDDAIWKTSVGQVSNVIDDSGAFFLVKVVSRQDQVVHTFADSSVQNFIKMKLKDAKSRAEQDAAISKLEEEGIYQPDPDAIKVAVDMAMQNYWKWSKEK